MPQSSEPIISIPREIKTAEARFLGIFARGKGKTSHFSKTILKIATEKLSPIIGENGIVQIQIRFGINAKARVVLHAFQPEVFSDHQDMFGSAYEVWGARAFLKGAPEIEIPDEIADEIKSDIRKMINEQTDFLAAKRAWKDVVIEHERFNRRYQIDFYSDPNQDPREEYLMMEQTEENLHGIFTNDGSNLNGFSSELAETITQDFPRLGYTQLIFAHLKINLFGNSESRHPFKVRLFPFRHDPNVEIPFDFGRIYFTQDVRDSLREMELLDVAIDRITPTIKALETIIYGQGKLKRHIKTWRTCCQTLGYSRRQLNLSVITDPFVA